MDNAFTQILIQEIENMNLVYAQYKLMKLKWELIVNQQSPLEEEQKRQANEILNLCNTALDNLRISISQITLRFQTIQKHVKLPTEKLEQVIKFEHDLMEAKPIEPKDFSPFVQIANEIYVENILGSRFESNTQIMDEMTARR